MQKENTIVMNQKAGFGFPDYNSKEEEREDKKRRLAAAFRLFGKLGFDEGGAGHISLRDPIFTDHFWVNPLTIGFKQIKVSDLLLVNANGDVVEGHGLLNGAAFTIHSHIHSARPEVESAAHAHSIFGKTWSTLGRKLQPITQDACVFYNDHELIDRYSGVVLSTDEGKYITEKLGRSKGCILQNHGLLTVGTSVDSAVWWYMLMERCCQSQLMAEAVGRPTLIDADAAERTRKIVGNEIAGWFSFQTYYRDICIEQAELLS